MTNYLNAPVFADDPALRNDVLIEGWLHAEPSSSADSLGWDTLKKLRGVPYGIYLAFEQGRNCPPMVLAWRDQPEVDLSDDDEVGYELHAVAFPGHHDGTVPELIHRFHTPVDEFIAKMAVAVDAQIGAALGTTPAELVLDHASGGSLKTVLKPQLDALITAAGREVARFIYHRIEQEQMILRGTFHDGRTGRLLGLSRNIAPGLAAGWDRLVNREAS